MTESHDCGHACCDERTDPHHGHFLDPDVCPRCASLTPPESPASRTEEPTERAASAKVTEGGIPTGAAIPAGAAPAIPPARWVTCMGCPHCWCDGDDEAGCYTCADCDDFADGNPVDA